MDEELKDGVNGPGPAAATDSAEDFPIVPGDAKVCGNCRLFRPVSQQEGVWQGECRLTLDRGMFPATAPLCGSFLARAAPMPRALRAVATTTRSERRAPEVGPVVHRARGDAEVREITEMTRDELKSIIREALFESEVRLAPRWEGGTVVVKPANETLQSKEIPVDSLFHKVVMVRDRLRVLEQKLNASPKLTDAEKVELQQYVTRCYGSLTTFNFLFADKEDQFVGDKGKGD